MTHDAELHVFGRIKDHTRILVVLDQVAELLGMKHHGVQPTLPGYEPAKFVATFKKKGRR